MAVVHVLFVAALLPFLAVIHFSLKVLERFAVKYIGVVFR